MQRRHFLRRASLAAAAGFVPHRLFGEAKTLPGRATPAIVGRCDELYAPDLHALVLRAVDAARSAGASYADAHITWTRTQSPGWTEGERRAIGVRALVNGYWGFFASTVWSPDEAARLARGAVAQATAHGRGRTRAAELGPRATIANGEWIMPVKYDPFDIPVAEKLDVMNAFTDYASSYQVGIGTQADMAFLREQRISATSDDASWSQTTYQTQAGFSVTYRDEYHAHLGAGAAGADGLGLSGRGWEMISESGLIDMIPQLIADAEASRYRTVVDVGRYDMIFSADAMATILDRTLGAATELDRALGYEANAGGTSFLDEPLQRLGTPAIENPLITVTANRSVPHGLATVKWDNEGIMPDDFTIIQNGVLVDYQTTREQAAWLAPYYQRIGKPVRSHGCAGAESAMMIPMQHAPNLALEPGALETSFEELVASIDNGIAVLSLDMSMDQQGLNGLAMGTMREIKKGKLGRYVDNGAIVFRAPEFWKSVQALGGKHTFQWSAASRSKGEPSQRTSHSVGAVPARIKQVSLIDPQRKA